MVKRPDSPECSGEEEGGEQCAGQWAQALSKGVHVHKVNKRGVKRGLKSPGMGRATKIGRLGGGGLGGSTGDPQRSLCQELLRDCLASRSTVRVEDRVESYTTIIQEVEHTVNNLQEEVFTSVFDSMVSYVREAGRYTDCNIPTAVLLTGVNMPDHVSLFSLLLSKLSNVSSHVSLISPGLTLRSLVTQVVTDLVSGGDNEEVAIKKCDASLSALSSWYLAEYTDEKYRPPLIVILQQFEGSAGPALQDLLTLMSRHSHLPFVLILGVATTLANVHKSLPQAITAKLTIHTFGSPPATLCLDRVVERVLVSPSLPFKLDHKVFQFLIENFLYHDFAIRHFTEGFKFILGEHFYRSPASILCCDFNTLEDRLASLNNSELDCVRRLPSMRKYIESLPLDEQAQLLTSPTACKQTVRELMKKLTEHVDLFTCLVKCLNVLVNDLPRKPLGKSLRITYELCLAGQVTASHQFKEAWRYLQLSNRVELHRKVDQLLNELSKLKSPKLMDLQDRLSVSRTKLSQLEDSQNTQDTGDDSMPDSPSVGCVGTSLCVTPLVQSPMSCVSGPPPTHSGVCSPSVGSFPVKLDRFNLKQSLQALKDSQKKCIIRPYDLLRSDLLTHLLNVFQEYLVPPVMFPLHEVTTFTSLAAVKRHLVGAPRAAVHTALTQPGEYLDNPTQLHIEDPGEIKSSFPDLAIGYKLHLECPRLINVYDWLTCWNSIVTESDDDQAAVPPNREARFAQVVSELQMLGFIRTSSKKTDHVARLTFGGS